MRRLWQRLMSWPQGCLVVLVSSMLVFGLCYWGYCWGWWGRSNLVVQCLIQCHCPPRSETVHYRPFTVLASACSQPIQRDLSPSGRYILIEERPIMRLIRHDLLAGDRQVLSLDPVAVTRSLHLDDQLLFVLRVDQAQASLFNLQEGKHIPLPYGKAFALDPSIEPLLHAAEQVLVFDVYVLALAPNYLDHPDQNIVLYTSTPAQQERVLQQLTDAGIAFTEVPPPYTTGPVRNARYSHDGQYYALQDGIYRADSQERILPLAWSSTDPIYGMDPRGWTPDNKRFVYAAGDPHLIDRRRDLISFAFFPVPQPILLVVVPEGE